MKNLIVALGLFFGLAGTAQIKKVVQNKLTAQNQVVAPTTANVVAAQKNVADLNAFTPLKPEMKAVLLELFTTKYRMLNDSGSLSEESKTVVAQTIEHKLEATLDGATYEKVKSNAKLFKSLVN
jgi:UDP-N-acetylglucosamine 2-epimerase